MSPRLCANCLAPATGGHCARGRCRRCTEYWRRHGAERPPTTDTLYAAQAAVRSAPAACGNCLAPVARGRSVRGRCPRCADYWQRHDTERPPTQDTLYAGQAAVRATDSTARRASREARTRRGLPATEPSRWGTGLHGRPRLGVTPAVIVPHVTVIPSPVEPLPELSNAGRRWCFACGRPLVAGRCPGDLCAVGAGG